MNNYIADEYDEIIDVENFAEGSKERFCIDSLDKANWAFRKLVALNAEKTENTELAVKEIDRINHWLVSRNNPIDNRISNLEGLLMEYYITEKDKDNNFKLSTPYGKVTSKKGKDYTYNEELLIEELNDTDYIVVKKSIDKNKLKKEITVLEDGRAVTSDGVVLEGVTVTDKVSYSVKPAMD
ncbi:MAG: host-nuclease inhibitor Gam family protein [Clostridia bacterium]|nr:host-nuclease inhibitor Gam family protein [Clostridia bacterium]